MTAAPRDRAAPRAPEGAVIYAVGDVHGRLDLLQGVTRELRAAAVQAPPGVRVAAVFLGDYIDRGPDPAGVLAHLIDLRDAGVCETHFLRGGHEQMLLDLIDGQDTGGRWLDNGGAATLAAYGAAPGARPGPERLRRLVREIIPTEHRQFLRDTRLQVTLGDYFFAHAGVRPDRPPEQQAAASFLQHQPFGGKTPVWPYTLVHGHLPHSKPVRGEQRIGLDTEAHASGLLSVLILERDAQAFFRSAVNGDTGRAVLAPWRSTDDAYPRARRGGEIAASANPPRRRWTPLLAGSAGLGATVAAVALSLPLGGFSRDPAALQAAFANVGVPPSMREDAAAPATGPVFAPPPLMGASSAAEPAVTEPTVTEPAVAQPSAPEPPIAVTPVALREAEPDARPVAPPVRSGVRVQVAATESAAASRRAWEDLAGAFPAEMQARAMRLEAVTVRGRTVQRTFVSGFGGADEARAFCAKLTAAGRGCLVRGG
jgi:serine/threonine protein phosphatase 1